MAHHKCRFCLGGIAGSQQVVCPVCDGFKGVYIQTPKGLTWVRCVTCMGLGFILEPIPCKVCRGTGYRSTW